ADVGAGDADCGAGEADCGAVGSKPRCCPGCDPAGSSNEDTSSGFGSPASVLSVVSSVLSTVVSSGGGTAWPSVLIRRFMYGLGTSNSCSGNILTADCMYRDQMSSG